MLKCIIVDDQERDRQNLRMLLQTYCPDVDILAEAYDARSLISALSFNKPDVVFLDIDLGTSNCFDILDDYKISTDNFKIIFVTGSEDYAIRGYSYNAVDYMLKPILPEQLIKVLHKVKLQAEEKRKLADPAVSFSTFSHQIAETTKIQIKDGKQVYFIKPNDILCLIGGRNYTTVKLTKGREIVTIQKLKDFESLLCDTMFIRIHRSHIINVTHVSSFSWDDGFTVSLANEIELPVSRNYKQQLLTAVQIND